MKCLAPGPPSGAQGGRDFERKGPRVSDLGVRIHTSCHLPRLELEAVGSWQTLPPLEYLGLGVASRQEEERGAAFGLTLGTEKQVQPR